MSTDRGLTLGVIVCCRDEARVVERRLRNLAFSTWPASHRPHRVVVVDDGSRDATLKLAQAFLLDGWPQGVVCEVIENRHSPGKAGAIASGIESLGASVDVVVLTDADVATAPDALLRLEAAFARSPELGLACGSQRFVRALPEDGSTASLGGGSGGDVYDRLTDLVRVLESRAGRLFSVHGQLLAWRSSLRLLPRPAIAADDLDLMLQARIAGTRVERIAAARFFEVKPRGWARRHQTARRARAFMQIIRGLDLRLAPDHKTQRQWRAYCYLERYFAAILYGLVVLVAGLLLGLLGLATWAAGRIDEELIRGIVWILPWVLIFAPVIRLWDMFEVILVTRRLESEGGVAAQWSTKR